MLSIVPVWLHVFFACLTCATCILLLKALPRTARKKAGFFLCGWLALQGIIAATGFYTNTTTLPPRFVLAIIPPFLLISLFMATAWGRKFIASVSVKNITWMQTVRLPVELALYALFIAGAVPEVMTFHGINLDIITGITAPLVALAVSRKKNTLLLLVWNVACLLLLANIVFHGILSVPAPFQRFGFEQPNIALMYFPFVWLPAFIVPAALFGHVVTIFQWVTHRYEKTADGKRAAVFIS